MQVVAGGCVVAATLSVFLENLDKTLGSKEQMVIVEFAVFVHHTKSLISYTFVCMVLAS